MLRKHGQLWLLIRRPIFRRLWLGLVLSRLGDQFTTIALLWFVYELTGSGTTIGLIILFFRLPGILTGPLFGRLLDRHQPRLVLGADNFIRAMLIAVIALLYWLDSLKIWPMYVIALLPGALSPATEVGIRTLIPDLVSEQELEQANALSAMSWELSILAAPVSAGVLTALFGGSWVLLFDAISFFIMKKR